MAGVRCILLVGAACSSAACTIVSGLSTLDVVADEPLAPDGGAASSSGGSTPVVEASARPGHQSEIDGGEATVADAGVKEPPVTTTAKPVGDWPFDERGTALNDVSGHEHHGAASGGRWTADRSGSAGSAFLLEGGGDHVSIPGHSDFDRPPGSKFSIVAWARVDAAPNHSYIFDVGFGSEGYGIELISRTRLTYWDGVEHTAQVTIPDVVGTWHHYAISVDGEKARVYFDGVRVREGVADTTPRTATKVVFGLDAVEPVYLKGALDKVRFFRVALTDAEIAAEMDR